MLDFGPSVPLASRATREQVGSPGTEEAEQLSHDVVLGSCLTKSILVSSELLEVLLLNLQLLVLASSIEHAKAIDRGESHLGSNREDLHDGELFRDLLGHCLLTMEGVDVLHQGIDVLEHTDDGLRFVGSGDCHVTKGEDIVVDSAIVSCGVKERMLLSDLTVLIDLDLAIERVNALLEVLMHELSWISVSGAVDMHIIAKLSQSLVIKRLAKMQLNLKILGEVVNHLFVAFVEFLKQLISSSDDADPFRRVLLGDVGGGFYSSGTTSNTEDTLALLDLGSHLVDVIPSGLIADVSAIGAVPPRSAVLSTSANHQNVVVQALVCSIVHRAVGDRLLSRIDRLEDAILELNLRLVVWRASIEVHGLDGFLMRNREVLQ